MSLRSGRKSIKSSSRSEVRESKRFANVLIKIRKVEFQPKDDTTEAEIVAKFMNNQIKCRRLGENSSNSSRFQTSEVNVELLYEIKVDIDDAEGVFNLFANPVEFSLMISKTQEKDSRVVSQANIDLYPLCSDQIQNHQTKLVFEAEMRSDEDIQSFHGMHVDVEITSNQPILKAPHVNCLYVTIDSICNLEMESSTIAFGLKAPLESEFNKSVVFSTDTSYVFEENDVKKWFNLSHVEGKGAESKFAVEAYNYPMTWDEENLLDLMISRIPLNAIGRIILTEGSNNLLHRHLKKSMKIAVEVMSGGNHYIGFINGEDLNQVGRKKLQCVVPLKTFNTQTLAKNCNYPSVFYRPKSILKSRKSKKDLDRKSVLATISESPDEFEEVSVTNKDGEPVFIVIELELEKPLNEEIYEDASEQLIFDDGDVKCDEPVISQKLQFEKFRINLENVAKNVSNIYGKEAEVSETISRMISDGYFASIEDYLLPEICSIGREKFIPSDDFNEFRDSFMCEITSHILNARKARVVDRSQKILMSQVYEFLGLEQKSEEIFLNLIIENDSEENWIAYAVYNLRKEKFSKTVVCIEETGKRFSISLVGHILKCYIEFKLRNFPECWRLLTCMTQHHGNFLELSMIAKIISMVDENDKFQKFSNDNFKQQPEIEEIYHASEMSWFANSSNDNLLNWQDPFIHCAILFIKLGCFDFAELVLGEYFATHGLNINFLYLLSVINAIKGNYRQSLHHLEQIAKEDIGNHQVHYDKIVSLMSLMQIKLDDFQGTEKFTRNFESIENLRLEDFLHNFALGQLYNDHDECKTSLQFLIQAHRIFPSHLTLMQLGKCYQRLNKLSSAEICFSHAINCDLNDTFAAWNHLYDVYMKQNRLEMVNLCTETLNCF